MLPHAYDVAVVVPMFNAAETMTETVQSVVAQTNFDAIQLILVNNNSTDNTLQVAQQFAQQYPNIEVVDHPTGKCGGARNAGIAHVRAPWVAFLDADDLLPPDSIETRLSIARRDDSDVVLCAVELYPAHTPYTPVHLYDTDRVIEGLDAEPAIAWVAVATHLLLRTEFFDDPRNLFPENTHFEDVPVTTAALSGARRISISSRVGYLYRREARLTTIMSSAYSDPANYMAHLRICASVAERHRDHPTHHVALGRMLLRFMTSYIAHARATLNSGELHEFFTKAGQLYRQYPVELVAERCINAAQALSLYALMSDDFDLFCDPASQIESVAPSADSPHGVVRLNRPHVSHAEPLLVVRRNFKWIPAGASILKASAKRDMVTLSGQIVLTEPPAIAPPMNACGLRLMVGAEGRTFDVTATPTPDPQVWNFTTDVDVATLPPGKHRLRLTSNLRPRHGVPFEDHEPIRPGKGLKLRRSAQGTGTLLVVSKSRLAAALA